MGKGSSYLFMNVPENIPGNVFGSILENVQEIRLGDWEYADLSILTVSQ